MGLLGFISSIIKPVANTVDEFITTDEERLQFELEKQKLQLKEKQLDNEILEKIHETNIAEAKFHDRFIAGWRPFIGWVCGIALAYSFVIAPFLHSLFEAFHINFPLPELDIGLLVNLLLGMLGLAGLRTYEKVKGVNNRH